MDFVKATGINKNMDVDPATPCNTPTPNSCDPEVSTSLWGKTLNFEFCFNS